MNEIAALDYVASEELLKWRETKKSFYHIDTDQSTIEWAGRNPNTKHFGTIGISNGQVSISNNNITGVIEINMNSIENFSLKGDELQPVLISHLNSDDFFFTK